MKKKSFPKQLILSETQKFLEEARDLRHLLHQIPEISFGEIETSRLIINELKRWGIKFEAGLADTGIMVQIQGKDPGDVVAFRADMDGVRVRDLTKVPYVSKNEGLAHACGHDGHVASLLGAAKVIHNLRDHFSGEIRLIFQPGEEVGIGAQRMIKAGVLENPRPKCIFALHAWPYIPPGVVASKSGTVTSANEVFKIVLRGSGGHGARHYETENPLNCAAKIIPKLYALTNVEMDHSSVVSIGHISGGGAPNVIPEELFFGGTMRTVDINTRRQVQDDVKRIVYDECKREGVRGEIEFSSFCPAVNNNMQLFKFFKSVTTKLLPEGSLHVLDRHSMGSEDFACYAEEIPGLLFRLGVGKWNGLLHHGSFNFNDEALFTGIALTSGLLLEAVNAEFKIKHKVKSDQLCRE